MHTDYSNFMPIQKAVKAIRLQRGWSQRQLAEAINVHRVTITHYESHEVILRAHRIQAIAMALEVEPGLLYRLYENDPQLADIQPIPPKKKIDKTDIEALEEIPSV